MISSANGCVNEEAGFGQTAEQISDVQELAQKCKDRLRRAAEARRPATGSTAKEAGGRAFGPP